MSFLNLSLHAAGGRMNGPLLDSNSLPSENAWLPMVSTSADMTASSLTVKSAGIMPGGYPIGLFPALGDTSIGLVIVGDCCSTAAPAAAVVRFGFTGVCACGPPIAPSLVSLRMRLRSARSSGVSSLCLCLCFLCAWASSGSVDSSPSRLTPPPRSEGPSLNFTLSAGAAPSGVGEPARGVPPGVLSLLDRFPLGTLAPMMTPASPAPPPAPVADLSSALGTAYIAAQRSASRRSHSACNRASSCACSTFFRYSSSAAPVSQPSTTSPSSSSSTSRSAAAFCFSSWSSSHAFSSMSTTASASMPTSSRIRTVSSR
mmetsp:Transcript_7127/g.27989  ORF Transcript_7127/g.27989 Transcript_7127/m.27989 type:complete len:315 (+) Transcript_7127:390-1334(+)